MDDFERMMGMESVRPLEQPTHKPRRHPEKASRHIDGQDSSSASEPKSAGYLWATGVRARTVLETALERIAIEIRTGQRGWATGICQNGTMVTLSASSGAASLLSAADRQSLRLMIMGGDGWTFVMHPKMGVATLDEDPK